MSLNMATSAPVDIPCKKEHQPRSASLTAFGATAVMLPIVSATVLPLSVAYQTGKFVAKKITGADNDHTGTLSLDSGYVVQDSQRIPREKRTYDIVVLGATGFTGGLAARHLAEKYGVNGEKIKWAIAGRSQQKLDQFKQQLAKDLGNNDILKIPTMLVDTSVPSTLPQLVSDTRTVATTAGPYCIYGSSVVEFCAKFGTHYVDITGEVDWVRAMLSKWQTTAQETGARLVPFCGHDSIPWDMLTMKMQEEFAKKFPKDEMESVIFWDQIKGTPPGGTIATAQLAIQGKSGVSAPKDAFDPFLRLSDGSKSEYKGIMDLPSFIESSKSPWDSQQKRWTMPFLMASINGKVVHWSHALRQSGSKQLKYTEIQVLPNFRTAFVTFFSQVMMGMMMFNPITNSLLQKYVLPQAGQGPKMSSMQNKHYLYVTGEGIGKAGNRVQAAMYFSKDVGCLETARMMVEAGLCLAQEEGKLLASSGGFWTPSTAMGDLLLDRIL
eukprot:CAMPEP_0198147812 /NCGR_PEP_ID=MMETSP1443-20131203/37910_1 /TAXON_ID=186043 /ORGANISM="Entomoneis sp., Strain CCMP2396" /LENGTH=494 /DNA_ID=CAMNT_0043812299 /DNA_START=71 /DNA_END=1552 /DNA_ORIENTATION=-